MLELLRSKLTADKIEELVALVRRHADAHAHDASWEAAGPLIAARSQREVTLELGKLVDARAFTRERGRELIEQLFAAHGDDPEIAGLLGEALEAIDEIDVLNRAPASAAIFAQVVHRLVKHADATRGSDVEITVLSGLATAARLLGRTWDETAERAFLRKRELQPERWQSHYGLGLFYKTRGRFAEGLAANQRAYELGGNESDAVRWNLGICATGARDAQAALRVWKEIGQKIELGRFGLPEGGYPSTKVQLAQRPLAERDPSVEPDDPGREETIWIERLSPCHGVVRCALFDEEVGVDFGDVVLFDGAPVTYHKYGDSKVPVFPHLVTLERGNYSILPFAGTQRSQEQIADLSNALPGGAVLYVHTERGVMLCKACWQNTEIDHGQHQRSEHRVVTGKLCIPPDVAPLDLQRALDAAVAAVEGVAVYVPDLAAAAGDPRRAEVEERRCEMIAGHG